MDIDQLLSSTRSARRTLDLGAPVDLDEVGECLQLALHAANGTNQDVSYERPLIVSPRA